LFIAPLPKSKLEGVIGIERVVESFGYNLGRGIEEGALKGRWIYYGGRVLRDSALIKKMKLSDMLERRVNRGQFNIISSNEVGLTVEE
jgi:hypothetical protein